jgi:hypothetical protein
VSLFVGIAVGPGPVSVRLTASWRRGVAVDEYHCGAQCDHSLKD